MIKMNLSKCIRPNRRQYVFDQIRIVSSCGQNHLTAASLALVMLLLSQELHFSCPLSLCSRFALWRERKSRALQHRTISNATFRMHRNLIFYYANKIVPTSNRFLVHVHTKCIHSSGNISLFARAFTLSLILALRLWVHCVFLRIECFVCCCSCLYCTFLNKKFLLIQFFFILSFRRCVQCVYIRDAFAALLVCCCCCRRCSFFLFFLGSLFL